MRRVAFLGILLHTLAFLGNDVLLRNFDAELRNSYVVVICLIINLLTVGKTAILIKIGLVDQTHTITYQPLTLVVGVLHCKGYGRRRRDAHSRPRHSTQLILLLQFRCQKKLLVSGRPMFLL